MLIEESVVQTQQTHFKLIKRYISCAGLCVCTNLLITN